MNLIEWAEKYRVKATRGKQGTEDLVLGKYGEIADASDGWLRLRSLAIPRDLEMNKALAARKREAQLGGLKPVHVTEHVYESVWAFNPTNEEHSRLAIELVRPKRRRTVTMTPERLAALAAARQAARMPVPA